MENEAMRETSEKPQKQLVSKGRYAWLMAGRTALHVGSILSPFLALIFLFAAVVLGLGCLVFIPFIVTEWRLMVWPLAVALTLTLASALCAGGIGVLSIRLSRLEESMDERMGAVAPLTKRTFHLLHAKQSLVRASDVPPSDQQAELLRATRSGNETPTAELLRAVLAEE